MKWVWVKAVFLFFGAMVAIACSDGSGASGDDSDEPLDSSSDIDTSVDSATDSSTGTEDTPDTASDQVMDSDTHLDVDTSEDTDTGPFTIDTDASGTVRWTDSNGNEFGLYLPDGWAGAELPIVMFLHGYTNNPLSAQPWIVSALNQIEPCAVFLPYRPASEGAAAWGGTYDPALRTAMVATMSELDRIVEECGFNAARQYVYGESMGGEGVFALLYNFPEQFGGAVAVAGYTLLKGAEQMAQTPLWILHGNADTINPVSSSQNIYQAILDAGGSHVTYTEFDGVDHNPSISMAAGEPGLLQWLLGSIHP
ncbi:MAG: hypothetical protein JXX29_06145 [Deltaproteobacteria bacterium]|nr:hypothetical protein [Deltaproteobacteria bacterium]MBN2671231.1 hypothetical protein [Deltaproteobacteria bacterium]